MTSAERRFPPPWSVEEQSACFVRPRPNGQALAYVYFEDEPGRRSGKLLSEDEARRIATPVSVQQAFLGGGNTGLMRETRARRMAHSITAQETDCPCTEFLCRRRTSIASQL